MAELQIKYSYPYDPNFVYNVVMEKVNLDDERKNSILRGQGFIIKNYQNDIKKDVRNQDGIFSSKFGATLQDVNPFADKYKCQCGHLTSRIHHGIVCEICNTKVKYVDDDFEYFGWIVLKDPHYIIHPNLYKSINHLFGTINKQSVLNNILSPKDKRDEDGYVIEIENSKKEPFAGIGILEFKERFDEIMEYYLRKNPNKKDYYNDIMTNKDKVFTQSIPVFTTHLRPYKISGDRFEFEGTNSIYNMMTKLMASINNDDLRIFRQKKSKNQLLYDLNVKFQELYKELENIISGKKGSVRSLFGGRYNFTSRNVIVPNQTLRVDEIIMPYAAMVELLQQTIINILKKSYNITYSDAHNIWFMAQTEKDPRVEKIILSIIKNYPRGIPVLLNRNPTINYGSIMQMFIVGITDTYTLGMPLQVLPLFAADFDGDVLNVLYIINQIFFEEAFEKLNPRNAMYISRNNGRFNNELNHTKDLLININTFVNLSRKHYSPEQLQKIEKIKQII